MTTIERLEAAYEMLRTELSGYTTGSAWTAIKAADQILNPVEYEEVEESAGWVNIYRRDKQPHSAETFATKEDADHPCNASSRIDCQEIKVKVRREKVAPLERSVTVPAMVTNGGVVYASSGGHKTLWEYPEFYDCSGYITFTTTDRPK
jgi:hypothetical protein